MPHKTIYVADNDVSVFERAQELAGGTLSAVIAQALRQFVETEESQRQEFSEIDVRVGRRGAWRAQRFTGRSLARWRTRDEGRRQLKTLTVYQTAKGRFALYVQLEPEWMALTQDLAESERGWQWTDALRRRREMMERHPRGDRGRIWPPQAWFLPDDEAERRLDVYETLEDLKPHVPEGLYLAVEQSLRGTGIEVLDI